MNNELYRIITEKLGKLENNELLEMSTDEITEYNIERTFRVSNLLNEVGVPHRILTGWIILKSEAIEMPYLYIELNAGNNKQYIDTMASIASNNKIKDAISISSNKQRWIYRKRHSKEAIKNIVNNK